MSRQLTILMYHYVRELEHSRFPDINGLTIEQFKGQLEYIQKYYTLVTVEELIAALDHTDERLPSDAAMLTFDDGYVDHFLNVFPILIEKGIQGCFFPIGKPVVEHRVLDMNKIHFILAAVADKKEIVRRIFAEIDELRPVYGLRANEDYYRTYAHASRFDTPEVAFTKTLLQKGLAEEPRAEIVDRLFRRYVADDEAAFAKELYMSTDQLKLMGKAGMYISSHSYEHRWLDSVPPATQEAEIDSSLKFLRDLDCDLELWSFTYPYGAHNEPLLSLLKARGCRFGLTTRVGIADLNDDDPLLLPRLDTNDLPKDGKAEPNEWTSRVVTAGRST